MRSGFVFALALAALAAGPVAHAAPAAPTPAAEVVAEVRKTIAERYVLPERRPALDAVLAQGLASGRYAGKDPAELAERINEDLERVGHDRHLSFSFNPSGAAQIAAVPADDAGPPPETFVAEARRSNHGVRQLQVLPGNVRYLAYDGFEWVGPQSAAALEAAMQFLADGDAVIIDLRRNGGGSPEAVQYLVSHFMAPGRPLMSFYMNGAQTADRTASIEVPAAGRMVGKPLYVLISPGTASAAEEFSGHVAGYKLGQLVGQTTAGAGFRNDMVAIPGGFVLSVSVGRAVLAATGKDWEATGHAPDVAVPVQDALHAAQALALRRLAADPTAQDRRAGLIAIAEAEDAQTKGGLTPALPLNAYAGAYGERRILVRDGRLFYQRGERFTVPLIPLGGDAFALEVEPTSRLHFVTQAGRANAFSLDPVGEPSRGRFSRSD